jgi:hypothetical protein
MTQDRPAGFSCAQAWFASLGGVSAGFAASGFRLGRLRGWPLRSKTTCSALRARPADAGVIALANAAAEHLARQRRFQFAADQALEFTRTVNSGL